MSRRIDEHDWPALAPESDWRQIAPFSGEVRAEAQEIVDAVRLRRGLAVREYAVRFGELDTGDPVLLGTAAMADAWSDLEPEAQALLERTAGRVRRFAEAQRCALRDTEVEVPGGKAGSRWLALGAAGCYAPGGRYPLPSSVLMTVITARVAGVERVLVASPRPCAVTLAAARVAGADGVLAVGGAHAIAALAFGTEELPPVDVIVGPGNAWVTAAKAIVSAHVRIDGLAGPSELVVFAEDPADPDMIAADLLAQAEHDVLARPILVTTSARLAESVRVELAHQLHGLDTAGVAAQALQKGGVCVCPSLSEAMRVVEAIAPEHLELLGEGPESLADQLRSYGGLFVGAGSAEVLGDYGAGPNHVLPTGGSARFGQGLSVLDFLALRSWLQVEDPEELARDAAALARLEGLDGHARSAERRRR